MNQTSISKWLAKLTDQEFAKGPYLLWQIFNSTVRSTSWNDFMQIWVECGGSPSDIIVRTSAEPERSLPFTKKVFP